MRSWVLAASLMAAVVTTTGVRAADLDDGPPPDRYGSAYDDPRYADIYRYPKGPEYGVPRYAPRPYVVPVPRERVYRDDDDDYVRPPPRRYSYVDPAPPYAGHCLPREVIRHRLADRGWHDFHAAELRGEVALVHARRPSGRLFALKVDRCSGDVLSASPLEGRFGPYAHGPRRWERFY